MQQRWAVSAVVIGLLVMAKAGRADEAEAVKAIEKLGGIVTVDAKQPAKPVVRVSHLWGILSGMEFTDAEVKHLKELKSFRAFGKNERQL